MLHSLSIFNVLSVLILHLKFESSPSRLSTGTPPLCITSYPVASTRNCWCCCESHASKCSYLILIDCKMSQQWQVNGKCNLKHALHQHQTAAENHLNTPPHLKSDKIKQVDLCTEHHPCWVTVYSISWYICKTSTSLLKVVKVRRLCLPSGSCSRPWNTDFSSLGCLHERAWQREMPTAETSALVTQSA